MSVILYGISNCDTVRKARRWLKEHGIDYQFHDLRQDGLDAAKLEYWNSKAGWEILLNKRGTSWRQLAAQVRDNIDEQSALDQMLLNPTLIKRPVLEYKNQVHVGFDTDRYTKLFG